MAVSTGVYASRPASPSDGDIYLTTDSFYDFLIGKNGAWSHILNGHQSAVSFPSFSWVNQGSATSTTSNGGISVSIPASASVALRLLLTTAPTVYTLTGLILPTLAGVQFTSAGLALRNAASGKIITLTIGGGGYGTLSVEAYTDYSTYYVNAAYSRVDILSSSLLIWLRIQDDGTNRTFSFSCDGSNFIQLHQDGRTEFMEATQLGWYVTSQHASYAPSAVLLSWLLEQPATGNNFAFWGLGGLGRVTGNNAVRFG